MSNLSAVSGIMFQEVTISTFVISDFKSLPNDKILDWLKLKVSADNKTNMTEK